MEVPESKLYNGGCFPFGAAFASFPIHASRMSIFLESAEDSLSEKMATIGAGL